MNINLTLLPLSMLYLSMIAALALFLALRVVKVRMETSIGLGSGKNENLNRHIRVQANLLENFLPFAVLFILAELNRNGDLFLHLVGAAFLIARFLHAYGFSKSSGRSFGRFYGTVISWLALISLIAVNFYQAVMSLL